MLERLNQPISLRRRPKPEADAPPVTAPDAEVPVEESAEAPGVTPARVPALKARRAPRRSQRTLVGLEIEPGQLVAVKARVNGHLVVERAVGTPIAPNMVRDGEV